MRLLKDFRKHRFGTTDFVVQISLEKTSGTGRAIIVQIITKLQLRLLSRPEASIFTRLFADCLMANLIVMIDW